MSTKNPPIHVRRSPIHGTGVYAARRIKKEEEIIFYKGKLVTHKVAEKEEDNGHTFLFTLNDEWVIEAAINGNDARWINHSCEPNCEAMLIEDDDGDRRKDEIVIQAMRTIKPGEELTYDYNIITTEAFTPELKEMWKCLCGSKKCRGIIIRPDRSKKRKKSKAGKKKKKTANKGTKSKLKKGKKAKSAKKPKGAKKGKKQTKQRGRKKAKR